MKITVFLILFLGQLLLTIQSDITTESSTSVTIINGTFSNSTVRQVAGKPIVIHTQIQYYDEPTLRDYQECFENLQKCKAVCKGIEDQLECEKQCPVCPLLIKEEIVIQGVNDTDYSPAGPPPINTTNIIRLTNEIHNIIESQRGNITHNNDNTVNIFQNVSRVGGEFGLGYNNSDPCCIILSLSKSCNTRRFSTSARCHRKRHRVCSRKCKSRVMQAKRVTVCEKGTLDEENEDYSDENCYETVEYIPYDNQKRHKLRTMRNCVSIPFWPYVKCGRSNRQTICRRCQSLTYQYVLRRGVPAQCSGCFIVPVNPEYEMYPMWQPGFMGNDINNGIDYEDDLDLETSDWRHDQTLCRLPNGDISENCNEDDQNTSELPRSTKNPEYLQPTNVVVDDDYYDDDNEQISRNRRHTLFIPSKYSRRHRL